MSHSATELPRARSASARAARSFSTCSSRPTACCAWLCLAVSISTCCSLIRPSNHAICFSSAALSDSRTARRTSASFAACSAAVALRIASAAALSAEVRAATSCVNAASDSDALVDACSSRSCSCFCKSASTCRSWSISRACCCAASAASSLAAASRCSSPSLTEFKDCSCSSNIAFSAAYSSLASCCDSKRVCCCWARSVRSEATTCSAESTA
mmetsp:Transcript_65047/g.141766  ORF Transcript_65047/g.141766 Transcript_65047/m.141766 type:complete len:214 (+) Transcript_65047:781-1422(+)